MLRCGDGNGAQHLYGRAPSCMRYASNTSTLLAVHPPVCIPTIGADTTNTGHGETRGAVTNSKSPELAREALGGRGSPVAVRTGLATPPVQKSPITSARGNFLPLSGASSSLGLAREKSNLTTIGLPDNVIAMIQSARASSTRPLYKHKCRVFEEWWISPSWQICIQMNNTEYQQNITVQYCFPDNNASCRKEVRTGPAYIFLLIFLSFESMCAVFLNLLVIISISHFKQLHTPTNLLVLSLAVADLLVGLFVMPVNIMLFIDSCWYLGKMACSILSLISNLSISASVCNLVFIAVDRYIAISDPLLYSSRITDGKISVCIILGWSFSLMYIIIVMHCNEHLSPSQMSIRCYGECVIYVKYSCFIVDLVFSFLVPCCLILVLYLLIFKVARRQAKAVRAVTNTASHKHGEKASSSSETKAAKTLSIVIFVYLACWIPLYLSSLSVESLSSSSMVWTVFIWLIYMNSSVNPLIYGIFYQWFRVSVKYIVTCRIFESSSSRLILLPEHV
ncbi:trace amine-associated receptor 6-like [Colossoma macropomum]|uniref:trace amine-associated receptor 6-like n=1 Tax=Colossoma macropomum TaxID=42526 RepID=UPI00186528A7|nr:trace amine-associated receptor 6-like [Colossoma macropomum]